jgi:hypothetical protein
MLRAFKVEAFELSSHAEKKVRDKAIKSLAAFLSENSENEIPSSEMKKLWKGIFYCECIQ